MPLFEFKCEKCELKFEKVINLNFKGDMPCPSCASNSSRQLISKDVSGVVKEGTAIPKDIDRIVGRDADKKWEEIEEKKSIKEKIKREHGATHLSRDLDGEYQPLSVSNEGKVVPEVEGKKMINDMLTEFRDIKNDPNTEKVKTED